MANITLTAVKIGGTHHIRKGARMRKVKTDTIEVWKAQIIEKEHIKAIRAEIKKRRDEVANVLTFDNTAYEKYQTMMDTYDECLEIIDKAEGSK